MNVKKTLILSIPYVIVGLLATKLSEGWRLAEGVTASEKFLNLTGSVSAALESPLPSFHIVDLCVGIIVGATICIAVQIKGKNAKKYRNVMMLVCARHSVLQQVNSQ